MLIQLFDIQRLDSYSKLLKSKITTHKGICECCGFQSVRFMRLICQEIPTNESDALKSAILVCPVCADAFDLARAHSKGKIVLLPEITQSELNCIVYGAWAIHGSVTSTNFESFNEETIARKDALLKNSEQLLQIIYKSRSQNVDKAFAYSASEKFCASEPGEMADCLRRFEPLKLKDIIKGELFSSLRYIPFKESYANEREYWNTSVFSKLNFGMLNDMSIHFYRTLKASNEFKVN
jgi:hypothetical protein